MRAADAILPCALSLLLLFLRPLDAAWSRREGGGCCRWPPGQDQDPLPAWCSGQSSFVEHPRDAPLQASFSTPAGTTPPAKDKPTPDWTAFFSFLAVLLIITLGLIAWRYKESCCGGWRTLCCPGSYVLESSAVMNFQMDDFPQSLLIPLPPNLHPYIESLISQGVEIEAAHINPLAVEPSEDNTASGSVVHRTMPSQAPELGPFPGHILDDRPPSEAALESGPFADPTQELIVDTTGEEKLHL